VKLYSFLIVILVLSSSTTAECRSKECMPEEFVTHVVAGDGDWWYFYYDSVFNIGTNWFIIVESGATSFNGYISFEFGNNLTKSIDVNLGSGALVEKMENGSISFPGSTFSDEEFNRILYINFTEDGGEQTDAFQLKIQINKPPAEDMIYLWGGMTVFWASIGAYVMYLSNKFRELSDKSGLEDGRREKN